MSDPIFGDGHVVDGGLPPLDVDDDVLHVAEDGSERHRLQVIDTQQTAEHLVIAMGLAFLDHQAAFGICPEGRDNLLM